MTKQVHPSSGNIFDDLGYPPDEAAILQMRAELLAELRIYIETSNQSSDKLIKTLNISTTRFDELKNGKWEKFSLEMLISLATKAGLKVTLLTAA